MTKLCTLKNRTIQDRAIFMYKVRNNLCPRCITRLFQNSDTTYNLRSNDYAIPRFNTVTFDKHSLTYMGPKVWAIIPKNIRELTTIAAFKRHIRSIDLNSIPLPLM